MVLPLVNIYVCTKFNFNPFGTFQDTAWISNHYGKKRLWMGDNSVIYREGLCTMHFLSLPSIYQHSFQSLLYFSRYGPDRNPLWKKKWLRGDNTVNIQGMIVVLVHCPSPHWHLYTKFHLNANSSFKVISQKRYWTDI